MIHRSFKKSPLATTPSKSSFGFVILCPSLDKKSLQNTVESINQIYPKSSIVCTVGNDASEAVIADLKEICEIVPSNDTITSLINVGMKNTKAMWNVIVFAGSWVRPSIYRQFVQFVKDEKDILFQVVDGYTNFVDGSLNGLIVHKNTFVEVGDFPESKLNKPGFKEMELLKLVWATGAISKGCRFKAIMGMKVS
jgi:hypothetical protein